MAVKGLETMPGACQPFFSMTVITIFFSIIAASHAASWPPMQPP